MGVFAKSIGIDSDEERDLMWIAAGARRAALRLRGPRRPNGGVPPAHHTRSAAPADELLRDGRVFPGDGAAGETLGRERDVFVDRVLRDDSTRYGEDRCLVRIILNLVAFLADRLEKLTQARHHDCSPQTFPRTRHRLPYTFLTLANKLPANKTPISTLR